MSDKSSSGKQENLVERETITVTRTEISQDFLRPEQVRLQLNKKARVHPLDIGALAYTVRRPQKNTYLAHLPHLVDEASFMPSRRKLLVALHNYVATTGNGDQTIKTRLNDIGLTLGWLDENGYSDVFESESSARKGYKAYVNELNHQIKSVELSDINAKTANQKQRTMLELLGLYWGDEAAKEIIREIPIIKYKRKEGEAPEERNVRFAVKTFLHLARGFASFVMENKPFPYLLKMPDYECYVFPSNANACLTPYADKEFFAYNYQEGRLSTPEEYVAKNGRVTTVGKAKAELKKSENSWLLVNAEPRHPNRMVYASLAMNSYMQLFILMTGIHNSELAQLDYDPTFELEKDLLKNDFRAIKMRAGGREVSYHLGTRKGLSIFKEYIRLRNWVLDGEDFPYLFFSMEKIGYFTGKYHQIRANATTRVYTNTRGKFFPEGFKPVTASMVRKHKSVVWNEIGVSQDVIASSLNHATETNHKYYAVSSPDKQRAEFGLFFESAKAAAQRIPIRVADDDTGLMSIASGHCDDIEHPKAMQDEPPIAPDCKTQFGCLYCEHYVCHADEEDIEKLYSLLYVVKAVREMAADFNHSDALLLELSIRVQELLKQVAGVSEDVKSLVEAKEDEVMECGILTPFWEFRLRRYEAMGVVING